ncbi:LAFE_0A04478g1_1 [Lachancea fermentati]|uniref:LAFE_0A04478g1_1 n=1 Tax=Lachancea fermentati TaxID=4955 RepID=A0A1G4M736_LACFM|nr:LAFE_0A04478g1_1 [Lachancea fermentati]
MAKGTPAKKKGGSRKNTPVSTPSKKKVAKKQQDEGLIPKSRIVRAVEELRKYTTQAEGEQASNNLLEDDEELSKQVQLIVVNTTSFTGSSKSFKPKVLKVENSIFKPWKEASVTSVKDFKLLVILRDQDVGKASEDALYDQLNESGITVDAVIGAGELKTKYKAFEKRRAFLQEFSLVLADDAVVSALPKLLGGKAYDKVSTTPVPVRTGKKGEFSLTTLANSIKKVYLHSVPVKAPRGTTLSAHLGSLEWFSADEMAHNIEQIATQLIKEFKIRSVFLKTNQSPVLPLYYNQDVLSELASASASAAAASADGKPSHTVQIGDVEVELSNFDRALMEIANPDELDKVFANRVSRAKRTAELDQEPASTKRAKN